MFWRSKREYEDFSEEIRAHIDLEAARLVEDGMNPDAARTEALKRFGNVVASRERFYESGRAVWLDCSIQDLRHAVRVLAKRPVPTVAAILTLALAIGACVSMFSLIDRVLFRPLAVADLSSLVIVERTTERADLNPDRTGVYWNSYVQLRKISMSTLDAVAASSADYAAGLPVSFGSGQPIEHIPSLFVTANYFQVLGLRLAAGRDFDPVGTANLAAPEAVLSHRLWRTRFGSDPRILSQTIQVNDVTVRIVGVALEGFDGTQIRARPPDLFLPLLAAARILANTGRGSNGQGGIILGGAPRLGSPLNVELSPISPLENLTILGRVKPDVALERAQAEFAVRVGRETGHRLASLSQTTLPLQFRAEIRQFLTLLAAAVGLTLLIGCANLASLFLARTEERRAELAIRAALGAARARLVQGIAAEVAVLVLAGSAVGFLIALSIDRGLSAFGLPGEIPLSVLRNGVDLRVLVFGVAVTTIVTLLIAFGSAWRCATVDPARDFKANIASANLTPTLYLAGLQVALSVALVFGALLFVRSVSEALATDLGFDREGLVSVTVVPPTQIPFEFQMSSGANTVISSLDAFADSVRTMPGISDVTVGPMPLLEGSDRSAPVVQVDGVPLEVPDSVEIIYIDPDYFTTLNQGVVRGRNLDDDVDGWLSPFVGIVNESAMRRFWPDRDPIGHRLSLNLTSQEPVMVIGVVGRLKLTSLQDDSPRAIAAVLRIEPDQDPFDRRHSLDHNSTGAVTVVGVVRDSKLMRLQDENLPAIYVPRSQHEHDMATFLTSFGSREFLILRTALDPQALAPLLRAAAAQEGLSIGEVTAFDDGLRALIMPQRLARLYLVVLGIVAVMLAGVGAYGLIAHAVARNEKEIGVRRALGAPAADIVRIVTRRTLWPVIGGAAGGSAFALWAGQFANRFMYGIGEADSATLIVSVAIVLVSTLCATAIPVRRALRVNPVETLRAE